MTVWLLMHVPGFAFLCLRVLEPAWSFVVGGVQALWWWRKRAAAQARLDVARDAMTCAEDVAVWYDLVGFAWTQDPLGGMLDFRSRPWVSVARNGGDCDDMADLSAYLVSKIHSGVRRYVVRARDGRGHAVLVIEDGLEWVLVSNQRVGRFGSLEDALRYVFHDATLWWYRY